MTSASAQDRVAQAHLLLCEAERELIAAQLKLDEAYSVFCEARVLAQPQFNVEPFDERSVAERQRDRDAAREDVSP